MPDQWTAGYVAPTCTPTSGDPQLALLDSAVMHGPAYPKGDLAYVSYGGAGMVILDISDITLPRLVGQLRHHPPFAGKLCGARCHTVLPCPSGDYAIMTSEGERFHVYSSEQVVRRAQPLNFIGMVDVSDPTDPTLISIFPYPEVPEGYPYGTSTRSRAGAPARSDRTTSTSPTTTLRSKTGTTASTAPTSTPDCGSTTSATPSCQGDRLLHPARPERVGLQQRGRRPVPGAALSAPPKM